MRPCFPGFVAHRSPCRAHPSFESWKRPVLVQLKSPVQSGIIQSHFITGIVFENKKYRYILGSTSRFNWDSALNITYIKTEQCTYSFIIPCMVLSALFVTCPIAQRFKSSSFVGMKRWRVFIHSFSVLSRHSALTCRHIMNSVAPKRAPGRRCSSGAGQHGSWNNRLFILNRVIEE